jgi:hypothetical protein
VHEALGAAKIHHFDHARRRHDDLRRSQAAVQHAVFVRVRDGGHDLQTQIQRITDIEPLAWNCAIQGRTVELFHGDVRLALELPDVVDGADVLMLERCCGMRVSQDPRLDFIVICGQELENDVALGALVVSAVELSDAARANLVEHTIRAEVLPNHRLLTGRPGV